MDEFEDIDKEIIRLKEQLLRTGDDWAKQFQLPSTGDYWKRRMEEERSICDKKVADKQDETEQLKNKIAQQQSLIDRYSSTLKDLENKIEKDSEKWEERLKTKESELVFERNRLLWEEKVNSKEIENHSLLEKISELNSRISDLKDEYLIEREKAEKLIQNEKNTSEERVVSYISQVNLLTKRVSEVEDMLKTASESNEKLAKQLELTSAEHRELVNKILIEKENILKSKADAELAAAAKIKQLEQQNAEITAKYSNIHGMFLENVYKLLGPAAGLAKEVASGKMSEKAFRHVNGIILNIESEMEKFSAEINRPFIHDNIYILGVVADSSNPGIFEKILKESSFRSKTIDPRNVYNDLQTIKPQALLISSKYADIALKVKKLMSFMPIVVIGDLSPKMTKKLETTGIEIILPPYMNTNIVLLLREKMYNSASWPEFWHELNTTRVNFKHYRKFIVSAALISMVAITGWLGLNYYKTSIGGISMHSMPYSHLANITLYDGKLWICDWLGQSVYVHELNGPMRLDKKYNFTQKHFSAIAWAGGYFWSCDPLEKKIYKHKNDENLTIVGVYDSPNGAPSALCGDGNYIYTGDNSQGQIYRHNLDEKLSVDLAVKSPGPNPSGLYYDGVLLWSSDSSTNKIYLHELDSKLTIKKEFKVPVGKNEDFRVDGLAVKNGKAWVSCEKSGEVLEFPVSIR